MYIFGLKMIKFYNKRFFKIKYSYCEKKALQMIVDDPLIVYIFIESSVFVNPIQRSLNFSLCVIGI